MKQELAIVVVVYRGIAEQVRPFDSLDKANKWISSFAEREGKTVSEMQASDYDISTWELKCEEKDKWEVILSEGSECIRV